MAQEIFDHFTYWAIEAIEYWLVEELRAPLIRHTGNNKEFYFDHSIYRQKTLWSLANMVAPTWGVSYPVAQNVQIADVHLGLDKIGHFFSSGWHHYQVLKEGLHENLSPKQAFQKMIEYGVEEEQGMFGMAAAGIVSQADMEANYQGVRFYFNLCKQDLEKELQEAFPKETQQSISSKVAFLSTQLSTSQLPTLIRKDNEWKLSKDFNFGKFVNPNWDEVYNNSIFNEEMWELVKPVIQKEYCPLLRDDPSVLSRLNSYQLRAPKNIYSEEVAVYVREGKLLDPSRFHYKSICQ